MFKNSNIVTLLEYRYVLTNRYSYDQ